MKTVGLIFKDAPVVEKTPVEPEKKTEPKKAPVKKGGKK